MDRLFTHTQFSSADAPSPTAWRFSALCHLHRLCASVRRLGIHQGRLSLLGTLHKPPPMSNPLNVEPLPGSQIKPSQMLHSPLNDS